MFFYDLVSMMPRCRTLPDLLSSVESILSCVEHTLLHLRGFSFYVLGSLPKEPGHRNTFRGN